MLHITCPGPYVRDVSLQKMRANREDDGSPRLGPGRKWTVEATEAGVTVDKFLAAEGRLGSRSKAADARKKGKVFVNDGEVGPRDVAQRLRPGDVVSVWQDRPGSAKKRAPFKAGDLNIVYEDEYLIVLNKPAGLLAVPLERREEEVSVVDLLEHHLRSQGKRKPLVVHRIDRDTSGLVLFAKDPRAQAALKAQFRERSPERVYLAIVYGRVTPPSGTWRDFIVWDTRSLIQKETHSRDPRATEAVSHYKVLEQFDATALVEVRLHTGKRNQIRLQSRLRGHTLVGEQRYTYGPDEMRPIPFKRQALHAHRLVFTHPVHRRALSFEAPLPADMSKLLRRLRHK